MLTGLHLRQPTRNMLRWYASQHALPPNGCTTASLLLLSGASTALHPPYRATPLWKLRSTIASYCSTPHTGLDTRVPAHGHGHDNGSPHGDQDGGLGTIYMTKGPQCHRLIRLAGWSGHQVSPAQDHGHDNRAPHGD